MTHRFTCRIYFEDTDLAGIVYYANYLKFIERARGEYVRELGLDQTATKRDTGVVFAVRRVEADYLSPARFDDVIEVRTTPIKASPAQIVLDQSIWRDDRALFQSQVTLVALKPNGRPTRLPKVLVDAAGRTAPSDP